MSTQTTPHRPTTQTPHISTSHASLIVPPLRQTTPDRLARAVSGLLDRTLTVTLVSTSEAHIYAICANSTRSYDVSLTADATSCSCPDAQNREGIVCKHICAVCLFASQPQPPAAEVPQQFPIHHLRFKDTGLLCGAPDTSPAWPWPWYSTMLNWPECCASCRAVYRAGYNRRTETWNVTESTARRAQGTFHQLAPGGEQRVQVPSTKAA